MHKPESLSVGAELLVEKCEKEKPNLLTYDVVIVGSGYGGAVAAARFAGGTRKDTNEPLKVCVLERGREHLPGTFPNSFSQLPGHVRYSRFDDPVPAGARDGLFDLRIGEDVSVLLANGLGGGSLINAGVAAIPDADVFRWHWPEQIRAEWSDDSAVRKFFGQLQGWLGAHDALPKAGKDGDLLKHEAFRTFTQPLGRSSEAKITVNESCVQCGDCATGCNVGAKNTLSTNYLGYAVDKKAEIYTGVTVSHVEKLVGGTSGARWDVYFELSNQTRPLRKPTQRQIRANTVILAAGALGSTEILMRSSGGGRKLQVSRWLGRRFSTNGDMISALLHDGETKVNASAKPWQALEARRVGPTITGIVRKGDKRNSRIVVEELAIPGALRRVFEEVVTTTKMLHSLGKPDCGEHRLLNEDERDPAAVDPADADRCQVIASMGDDRARGRLELVPGWDDDRRSGRSSDGAIRVHWPRAGKASIFARQDELLSSTGLGTYLRNPLWQPIPKGLSKALSGAQPGGLLFSVHPLGGCPMGDSAKRGVVDPMGRVFDPADGGVHEGLLVLDGSIVPVALGINPLLTITALAERAIGKYRNERKDWSIPDWRKPESARAKKNLKEPALEEQVATELRFSERMTGELTFDGGGAERMEAELTLHFKPVADLADFLRNSQHPLQIGGGELKVRRAGDRSSEKWAPPVRVRKGHVRLLVRRPTDPTERTFNALSAYARARGGADLLSLLCEKGSAHRPKAPFRRLARGAGVLLRSIWSEGKQKAVIAAFESDVELGAAYAALASRVGEIRDLHYCVELEKQDQDGKCHALPTKLEGQKTLKYCPGANPWRQLTDLALTAKDEEGKILKLGTLSVDPEYLFRGFASRLQIEKQRDLPAAWMDLASLVLFLARIILKIHFWSFRLPDYQPYNPMRDVRRLPGELWPLRRPLLSLYRWLASLPATLVARREERGRRPGETTLPRARRRTLRRLLRLLPMERHVVGYPETPRDAGIFLPITRYRADDSCAARPVVLFHGLGSGGIQFATPWVKPNMAEHLAAKGFDVWVAELRTSIALPYSLDQWTLDEVARNDIPRIIDFVLAKTKADEVDVVAHCIGSAMFCTAVLDGRLQGASGKSKVRRAVLLQVGPLITLSKGTRLRGLVTAPLRRFFPDGHVDFSVDDRAGWVESLIDRLLNTYPYPPKETKHHRLRWFGRHNRHIANCNRWSAIDGRMFQHDNLTPEMLDNLGEVLGHSSLTIWTQTIQYAFLERLTDSEARNTYVTQKNVRDYFTFPVLFLHGLQNDVFDPLTSWRSKELIQRVHGREAAKFKPLEKYGHFDPLIGKNAETEVFAGVSEFLSGRSSESEEQQHEPKQEEKPKQEEEPKQRNYYVRRPLVGPVLGWTRWHEKEEAWFARVWCRIDDLRSPADLVLVIVKRGSDVPRVHDIDCAALLTPDKPDDLSPQADLVLGKPELIVGPVDTTLCLDVKLGRESGSYVVAILSAHRAGEPVTQEHLRAEIEARKRPSALAPHLTLGENDSVKEKVLERVDELLTAARGHPDDPGYDDKIDCARVEIPKEETPETVTLAVTSCRYPGWLFDRERADAAFGELEGLLESNQERPSALLLVGDQIYADATAGAFDPKDRRERFYEAYREAWTAKHAREVLSRLPTYMMLDDHEAGNDWHPGDEGLTEEELEMRQEGIGAFKRYQWAHSPRGIDGQPSPGNYYAFEVGGFPVFVCDTRCGRSGRERILDAEQFERLKKWLRTKSQAEDGARPKLVVSPSVVVPFLRAAGLGERSAYASRSDGWDGFPGQLAELFAFIRKERIENVVFLCGDSHLSMCSEIWFELDGREAGPRAYCIVASPMYAPYPFANSAAVEFAEDNGAQPLKLDGADATMRYEVCKDASRKPLFIEGDSVTLITCRKEATGWKLDVHVKRVGRGSIHIELPSAGKTKPQEPMIVHRDAT